jgi:hypothetical protein
MKKLSQQEKVNALTNFLRTISKNENLFITTDQIKGKKFAIAEHTIKQTLIVKTNFMTYEEMNCYFFGVLAVKENRVNF